MSSYDVIEYRIVVNRCGKTKKKVLIPCFTSFGLPWSDTQNQFLASHFSQAIIYCYVVEKSIIFPCKTVS